MKSTSLHHAAMMQPWHKLSLIFGMVSGLWVAILLGLWSAQPPTERMPAPPAPPRTPPARAALAEPPPAETVAARGASRPPAPAPAAHFNPKAGADLIAKNDCVACHKPDVKVVGPAYRDIANRYRSDPGAHPKLVEKVRAGGAGSWGEIPMAPHPTLSNQQLGDMVAWILAQKSAEVAATASLPEPAPVEYKLPVVAPIAFADPEKIPHPRETPYAVAPLAPLPAAPKIDAAKAELGRQLFFDPRLSGDATISCATCHDPAKGFGDGQALSQGYPGALYFRNSPTLINATLQTRFMWDGRLDGGDPATLVRDMITEAYTMNIDSRLLQERLKQVPAYLEQWRAIFGDDEPYGPRVYAVVGEFLKTLRSRNAPFDRHLAGEAGALNESAARGLALFQGKASCLACHGGPLLSDGRLHATGVPEHPDVLQSPLRAITMLRHYSTFGVPNYMNRRTDLGHYTVTKAAEDLGKFRTAPLRELTRTAPYMHNGVFATLAEVIEFYDAGGGATPGKDAQLQPLNLTAGEKQDLLAFLQSLSGEPPEVAPPARLPAYQPREFGRN